MRVFYFLSLVSVLLSPPAFAKKDEVQMVKGDGVGRIEEYDESSPQVMNSHSVRVKRAPATLEAPIYAEPMLPNGKAALPEPAPPAAEAPNP